MFDPFCRRCNPYKKIFPMVRTLQDWARQHFSSWISLEKPGSDVCSPENTKLLKSRWDDGCIFAFFQFKDDHGGNQGSHCINFGI